MKQVWIALLCCVWLVAGQHAPLAARASETAQTGGVAVETVASMGGLVRTAAVDGQRAYVAEGADLVVLDVGDPSAPQRLGRLPLDRRARSIGAAGGYAYLLLDYALWTVDARDPARPQRAHVFALPFGLADRLRVSDGLLVARSSGTLYIFDLSDPAHPALQSTRTTFPTFFELSGRTLYLLEHAKGLTLLDLSDPRAPRERSHFVLPPSRSPNLGLALSGGRAVISTGEDRSDAKHVLTVSVANPDAPALLGDVVLDAPVVALTGPLLAVSTYEGPLRLLDTTDPVSPTVLATYPFQAKELLFRAGRLYAQGEDRLLILDVGNPSAPVLLGSYDSSRSLGLVAAVRREGQRLYASSERGVQILDVSQPLTPTLQGFVPFTNASKL
ncbi:MAG TPA: hypothetical protein VFS21_12455, partial [Roseiflexaceae bacterium]|nr:hypothetical protein [Roseiflexaceae bacterium]